ncbi:hypothetical protein T492DRAFT_485849 [Pavlovales sp. CCMP2436]|nr:hypothetical protein T492DRAFT_485849 [Pavlovales sp. CCMP2436]
MSSLFPTTPTFFLFLLPPHTHTHTLFPTFFQMHVIGEAKDWPTLLKVQVNFVYKCFKMSFAPHTSSPSLQAGPRQGFHIWRGIKNIYHIFGYK